ncbi:MAG: nicotinate-nucleotide adenylyltransferase [Phycisphaerae bacterium]|nr:nicotinate-nucleotide adenylyltransferase [Phycisphaerae bacterium]
MTDRIVLFGGTFDPVHNGHLIVARSIAEQLDLPKVMLVPAAVPPHKDSAHATAQQRLQMLRLGIAGEKLFEICELEISRAGPSYTLETVRQLRRLRGGGVDVSVIIGADMLEDLPIWRRVDELLDEAQIIVALRPPWDRQLEQVLGSLEGPLGRQRAQTLSKGVVTTPLIDISSTEIRRRAREGKSIRFLVPEAVEEFIKKQRVYVG